MPNIVAIADKRHENFENCHDEIGKTPRCLAPFPTMFYHPLHGKICNTL